MPRSSCRGNRTPPKYASRWVRFPKRTHRILQAFSIATLIYIDGYIKKFITKRWVRFVEWHVSFTGPANQSPRKTHLYCSAILSTIARSATAEALVMADYLFPKNCANYTPPPPPRPVKLSPFDMRAGFPSGCRPRALTRRGFRVFNRFRKGWVPYLDS